MDEKTLQKTNERLMRKYSEQKHLVQKYVEEPVETFILILLI